MMRADAVRNRERVLAAARDEFAAHGLGVPIDDIARAAGVGAGTVYRHFPTKEALYEAILLQRVEALASEATSLASLDRPGDAFFGFLASFANEGNDNRALAEALASGGVDVATSLAAASRSLEHALAELLARAQAAGAVRADVSSADLLGLLAGVHAAAERGGNPALMLAVIGNGLRPEPIDHEVNRTKRRPMYK